jgi:Rnl2 family RNA ligase
VHVMLSMALSGRTPLDGDVMSIDLAAFTPADKTIHAVKQWNLAPQNPSPFQNADVVGFWNGKPEIVDQLMRDRVPPAQAISEIIAWTNAFGKVTLVGNPIMSLYGFLAQAAQSYAPNVTLPWGFSGVCAKSFCSGVLGVPVKDLGKNSTYMQWHEGLAANTLPANDAAVGATVYCNAAHHASAAAQAPVQWMCAKPPQLGPVAAQAQVVSDDAPFTFIEYPKIMDVDFENEDSLASLCRSVQDGAGEWIATEKVHGSNLSVWTDGSKVRVGKRTGFLTTADAKSFFDFDRLISKVHADLMTVHKKAVDYCKETLGMSAIRGRRVQAGVQYAPTNLFYVFDIAVVAPGGGKLLFLPADSVALLVPPVSANGSLIAAEPLARGTAEEVLKASAEFQSTIPGRLGLPPLATPNFAEGLVIRPVHDAYTAEGKRVILKRKHPMFREFQGVGAADLPATELVFSLITPQRVASVASKYAAHEIASADHLADLVLSDALADAKAIVERRGEAFDGKRLSTTYAPALRQALGSAIATFKSQ